MTRRLYPHLLLELNARLQVFMEERIYPREYDWNEWCLNQNNLWETPPWFDELRELARAEVLWNLFLPNEYEPWSPGLTNVEIAPLFETMSKVSWAQAVFNCNASGRGNMEVLARYGTEAQQEQCVAVHGASSNTVQLASSQDRAPVSMMFSVSRNEPSRSTP